MPNWCRNHVTMQGLSKYYTKDKEGNPSFSFNTILPMPESLHINSGSSNDYAIMVYLTEKLLIPYQKLSAESQELLKYVENQFSEDWHKCIWDRCHDLTEEQLDEYYNEGKTLIYNIKNYGAPTWYEWAIRTWGTKWDACEIDINGDEIDFDTAWSPPVGVLQKLSELNPNCEVTCDWYEEGGLEGNLAFLNGECTLDETREQEWDDYDEYEEDDEDPLAFLDDAADKQNALDSENWPSDEQTDTEDNNGDESDGKLPF